MVFLVVGLPPSYCMGASGGTDRILRLADLHILDWPVFQPQKTRLSGLWQCAARYRVSGQTLPEMRCGISRMTPKLLLQHAEHPLPESAIGLRLNWVMGGWNIIADGAGCRTANGMGRPRIRHV